MVIVQLGANFGQDLGRKIKGQNLAPTSSLIPISPLLGGVRGGLSPVSYLY